MFRLTVCLLTYNSARLLHQVLTPLIRIADEMVVIDSGSSDKTLSILEGYGIAPIYHPYAMHGEQMNMAIYSVRFQRIRIGRFLYSVFLHMSTQLLISRAKT